MGQLIDEKFHIAYNLTYNTMAMHKDVDTSMLRRAIWNYIHCMFGIRLVCFLMFIKRYFPLDWIIQVLGTHTYTDSKWSPPSPVAYFYAYASENHFITAWFVSPFLIRREGELGTLTRCFREAGREASQLVLEHRGEEGKFVTEHLWYLFSLYHLFPNTCIRLPSWNLVPV